MPHDARKVTSWLIFDVRQKMNLTNLQRQWQYAARQRGLKVKIPFFAALEDGERVSAEVLLEGFGATRGMLIVSDFAAIEKKTASILRSGFGYSCMSQPSEGEVTSVETIDDVLQDWGICYCEEKKPNKAPEPTPGLVTSRAEMAFEMVLSAKARLAPSPVVAHL